MTRRSFLGWFIGLFLLLVGCMPRKAEQPPASSAGKPASPASPAPQRGEPAAKPAPPPPPPQSVPDPVERKFAQIPELGRQSPPPPQKSQLPQQKSADIMIASAEENTVEEVVEEALSLVQDAAKRKITFDLPGAQGRQNMTLGFQQVGLSKQLVFAQPTGEQLRVVPAGSGFVFANEQNKILGEKSGNRFIPWKLDLSKLKEAWQDPNKLRGLLQSGTNVFLVALAFWLGAKIAIVVLAGVAFLAFLALIVGLFMILMGPAVKAFKDLLKSAGIDEKQLGKFFADAAKLLREILREALREFRKTPQFSFS